MKNGNARKNNCLFKIKRFWSAKRVFHRICKQSKCAIYEGQNAWFNDAQKNWENCVTLVIEHYQKIDGTLNDDIAQSKIELISTLEWKAQFWFPRMAFNSLQFSYNIKSSMSDPQKDYSHMEGSTKTEHSQFIRERS